MAKVFGFTPLELRPGVNGEDFEKFFAGEYAPFGEKLGWKGYVLKADRGQRAGQYAVIWEMESVEARDHYIPAPGQLTEEAKRLLGPSFAAAGEKLKTFVMGWPFTDYVKMN